MGQQLTDTMGSSWHSRRVPEQQHGIPSTKSSHSRACLALSRMWWSLVTLVEAESGEHHG